MRIVYCHFVAGVYVEKIRLSTGFGRNMNFHNKSNDLMIFAGDALCLLRIKMLHGRGKYKKHLRKTITGKSHHRCLIFSSWQILHHSPT